MAAPEGDSTAVASTYELAREAIELLTAARQTVAVAESLTGGLLAAALTSVAGASVVVRGGVVAYATDLKTALLGVPGGLLELHGPVHPEVAAAMAAVPASGSALPTVPPRPGWPGPARRMASRRGRSLSRWMARLARPPPRSSCPVTGEMSAKVPFARRCPCWSAHCGKTYPDYSVTAL